MPRRTILPYNPKLKELAKQLRKNMTLSEVLLWDELKQKKMLGVDFDRQRPIDNFIVDFYCKDLMLAIEVDGDSHNHEESFKADLKRQKILESLGVQFLRFDDLEVKKNMSNVLITIQYWIEEYMESKNNDINKEPIPTPPKRGVAASHKISSEYNIKTVEAPDAYSSRTAFPSLEGLGVGKYDQHLEIAKEASLEAGKAILEVYSSDDFDVEKKGDDSPLTKADRKAHNVIVSFLEKTDIPILSEEGKSIPYEERKNWEYFWMVDPLDGTKEFIKRNGEFTVNIALIHKGKPILGVIYVPVLEKLYWGIENEGAYLKVENETSKLKSNKITLQDEGLKVVASRSHLNMKTEEFLHSLITPEIVSMGSSLKFMVIAEGKADVYPRFAPTMEWDTAAAQIIVIESGADVLEKNKDSSLVYNKENLLNAHFLVINN